MDISILHSQTEIYISTTLLKKQKTWKTVREKCFLVIAFLFDYLSQFSKLLFTFTPYDKKIWSVNFNFIQQAVHHVLKRKDTIVVQGPPSLAFKLLKPLLFMVYKLCTYEKFSLCEVPEKKLHKLFIVYMVLHSLNNLLTKIINSNLILFLLRKQIILLTYSYMYWLLYLQFQLMWVGTYEFCTIWCSLNYYECKKATRKVKSKTRFLFIHILEFVSIRLVHAANRYLSIYNNFQNTELVGFNCLINLSWWPLANLTIKLSHKFSIKTYWISLVLWVFNMSGEHTEIILKKFYCIGFAWGLCGNAITFYLLVWDKLLIDDKHDCKQSNVPLGLSELLRLLTNPKLFKPS